QPTSVHRDDGLVLRGVWVTAAARCAPPANRPTREELETCRRWLLGEMALLDRLRVVVVLGRVAHDAFLAAETARGRTVPRPRPRRDPSTAPRPGSCGSAPTTRASRTPSPAS